MESGGGTSSIHTDSFQDGNPYVNNDLNQFNFIISQEHGYSLQKEANMMYMYEFWYNTVTATLLRGENVAYFIQF